MCCKQPCVIRVYERAAWWLKCLNCQSLRPA